MKEQLLAIDSQILEIIKGYDNSSIRASVDVDFDSLALDIFNFQFSFNPFYQQFCLKKGTSTKEVKTLIQIPPVSVNVYKYGTMTSTIPESTAGYYFTTSGTTTGNSGRVYRDPEFFILRQEAILAAGKEEMFFRFYPEKVRIIFLDFPNRRHSLNFQPGFSVLANIQKFFGEEQSCFLDIQNPDSPDIFIRLIKKAQQRNQPMVVFGPSYSLSYLLTKLSKYDLQLPTGSMVMDSGGLKNSSYHRSYAEYASEIINTFAIDRYDYLNTFALSEVGSQFSDNVRQHGPSICKQCPPWAKVRVVKKTAYGETDCSPGEKGEVIIYDLLNRGSILALQTHDIAVKTETGFQILERGEQRT